MRFFLTILCLTFWPAISIARPVSYPTGKTIMIVNESDENSVHWHYTLDPKTSIGVRVINMEHEDQVFTGAQLNKLLKRWNTKNSQANLYLKFGAGFTDGEYNTGIEDTQAAGFMTVAADWETRRYFISGEASVFAREQFSGVHLKGRAGIAPYVAEFGQVHTWLMLQVDAHPDPDPLSSREELTVTPLVRFFKGPTLVEIGYSSNDEPLVNFIRRF